MAQCIAAIHNLQMQNGSRLAAVDLGSNSFRLEIGYLDHGHIQRTEYIKETVHGALNHKNPKPAPIIAPKKIQISPVFFI
jgi:hypothetical protein